MVHASDGQVWREHGLANVEQPQLALVLALGLGCQLLDAIERHLLGLDQRALCLHRPHESLLDEMELADRLARKYGRGIEPRLALKRRLELAQRGVLAHAADEPIRDLV